MALTINPYNLYLLNTYSETIADGEGLRYAIYLAGCSHGCPGCHNRASWNPHAGIPFNDEILYDIITEVADNPLLDGITVSGGDPFFQPKALKTLLQILKQETQQNIWCYTGYTYEQLLASPEMKDCLSFIDTLVDGRFELAKFAPQLKFRGSSNQRLIYLHENKHTIKYIQMDN